jgi:pimeloyl-ACP methyl ester carboxylesterase
VSSPISWTGDNRFAIIGYSLGGGIASAFTYYFPNLIKSLVLITPSGLVREKHIAWQSYILYRTEGILPDSLIKWLVRRRLDNPTAPHGQKGHIQDIQIDDAMAAELGGMDNTAGEDVSHVMESAVQWQLDHHTGFITAFVSAIRYAPITAQYQTYKTIGQRLFAQKQLLTNKSSSHEGLAGGKVILVLGSKDGIVIRDETESDHREMLGGENVETIVMDAGHDLPISKPVELAVILWDVWKRLGAL